MTSETAFYKSLTKAVKQDAAKAAAKPAAPEKPPKPDLDPLGGGMGGGASEDAIAQRIMEEANKPYPDFEKIKKWRAELK